MSFGRSGAAISDFCSEEFIVGELEVTLDYKSIIEGY